MRAFIALSSGLLITVLGSAFTGLAMGAWVFQETGSATLYGITLLINLLPMVVFGPIAGVVVDRFSRRTVLIVCEAVSAVTVVGLALIYHAGDLRPVHIFVAVGIQSLIRAVQLPAMSSVVVLLAPKEQVGRANGLIMLAQALGNTVGFAAGGFLLVAIRLDGVLLVDFATFLANIAILLFVQIPNPRRAKAEPAEAGPGAGSPESGGGLLAEIQTGYRVIGASRALVALLVFSAVLNLSLGYADAMLTPLVLSFASAAALGLVVGSMGVGAVLGSASLAAWGGPRRRITGLAGFALPLGLFLCLGALRPSVPLIAVAAVGFTFCFTIVDGTNRSILQLEVAPEVQGRVFATYNMLSGGMLAFSYLLAGPLADHVFEPLMRTSVAAGRRSTLDGRLTGSVGSVIGTGPGRGIALLMLLVGLVMLITAVVAYLQPSLRNLPDRPAGRPAAEPAAAQPPAGTEPLPVPTEAMGRAS
jgi:MFS transporter, DHA3 family, macrolide efflux protein